MIADKYEEDGRGIEKNVITVLFGCGVSRNIMNGWEAFNDNCFEGWEGE